MDITVQDCINKAKMGWYAELNDGKLIGFQKKHRKEGKKMHKGIVVDVSLEELESLIRDSQKLADIKALHENCDYPGKEARAILGVEEKKDGD